MYCSPTEDVKDRPQRALHVLRGTASAASARKLCQGIAQRHGRPGRPGRPGHPHANMNQALKQALTVLKLHCGENMWKHPRYGSNKDQNYSPPCRSFSPAFISYWLPISFEAKQWLKAWNGTNNPQLSFDLATSCWPTVSQDPLQYLSELLFDILWYCYHLLSLFIKLSSISCIATFRMPCSASMLWVYPCVLSFLAHAIVPEAGASLDLTND